MSSPNDFVISKNGVLTKYKGPGGDVVVPEGVTSIGKEAFYHCGTLISVILPEGVTSIGKAAFSWNRGLTSITLPDSLISIDEDAFQDCEKLKDVTFPKNLTSIGNDAFHSCSSLTSITLPEGLTNIGDSAFSFCTGLTSVTLPESIQVIGNDAFYYCKALSKINIPHPETLKIGASAFTQCDSLVDDTGLIIIADCVHTIHPAPGGKPKIVIPDGVKRIERHAFDYGAVDLEMSLDCPKWQTFGEAKSYGFGESVINRSGSTITFRGPDGKPAAYIVLACEEETEPKTNGAILSIRTNDEGFDFAGYDAYFASLAKRENKLQVALARIRYPYALSDYMRETYLTFIKKNGAAAGEALIREEDMACLSMLAETGYLREKDLRTLLEYAKEQEKPEFTAWLMDFLNRNFKRAPAEALKLPAQRPGKAKKEQPAEGMPTEEARKLFRFRYSDGGVIISECKGSDACLEIPEFIGGRPVMGVGEIAGYQLPKKLKKIVLPGTISEIGESTLFMLKNVEIVFREGVKKLPDHALMWITNSVVHLPKSLTVIGDEFIWNNQPGLIGTEKTNRMVVPKGSYAEQYCAAHGYRYTVTDEPVESEPVVQRIPADTPAKPQKPWKKPKPGTNLIPRYQGAETAAVFPTEVEGVRITGVANTAGEAPRNYRQLVSVVLPEGYTSIGNKAFSGCENLETIQLPSTMKEIGTAAFEGCKKLKELVLHEGITFVGNNIFSDAEIGTVVMYVDKAKIPAHLFFGCRIQNLVICGGDFKSSGNVFDYTGTSAGTDYAKRLYQGNFPENVYLNGRFSTLDLKGTGGGNAKRIHPLAEYDESGLLDEGARERIAKEKQSKSAVGHDDLLVQTVTVDEIYFLGSSFVLVGFDREPEVELKAAIERFGGNVTYTPSAGTNYLIVPNADMVHNSITKKALKLRDKGTSLYILREAECRKHMVRHDEKLFGAEGAALAKDYQLAVHDGTLTLVRYLGSARNLAIPERIGDYPVTAIGTYFMYDHGRDMLRQLTIPGTLKEIPEDAFHYCVELQEVRLGQGVQTIRRNAFAKCRKLKSVTIPDTVTRIEANAFSECECLLNIHIPASVQSVEPSAFYGCKGLQQITVDAQNPTYDSRNGCCAIIETATNTLVSGCSKTTIPGDVVEIGAYAFSDQTELREITIPEGVVSIQEWAFRGCNHLEKVTLPESLRCIGPAAFEWCSALQEITLPPNLEELHGNAFANCEKLKSIRVPEEAVEKYRKMMDA